MKSLKFFKPALATTLGIDSLALVLLLASGCLSVSVYRAEAEQARTTFNCSSSDWSIRWA